MIYPTFYSMEQDIKRELDLAEETFIQEPEMQGYFNEAISMIEHQIHTLCEDYFLSLMPPPNIVAGQTIVQLPANIYANKIRKIIWNNDNQMIYEITPIKDLMQIPWTVNDPNSFYQYIFLNNGVTLVNTIGTVIQVYPPFRETTNPLSDHPGLQLFYIRRANRYSGNATDVCDVPEWSNVIIQYVRYKCMIKEGHPQASQAKEDLNTMITNMVEALRSRAMDENNKLSLDPRTLSEYADFSSNYWFYWY